MESCLLLGINNVKKKKKDFHATLYEAFYRKGSIYVYVLFPLMYLGE